GIRTTFKSVPFLSALQSLTPPKTKQADRESLAPLRDVRKAANDGKSMQSKSDMSRPLFESLFQDLRYGLRMLVKTPVFSGIAILTPGLGIGANTAIFSVVNGVLLNPLPFHEPNQLVSLFEEIPNFKNGSISYPNFVDWRRMNHTFSAMAAYRATRFNLTG